MPRHTSDTKRHTSGAEKTFCISMQRTGTSSVGKFFRDFGFRWAGWPSDARNGWTSAWYAGDFEGIFSSPDFVAANAFEDSPWWMPDFYKVLYHRFPGARFILLTRDPGSWFRSMVAHSDGHVIGDNRVHCKVYRRELEFFRFLERDPLADDEAQPFDSPHRMKLRDMEEHYTAIYELHATEVIDFFRRRSPESLFTGRLEDAAVWQALGSFLGLEVPAGYRSHQNISRHRA